MIRESSKTVVPVSLELGQTFLISPIIVFLALPNQHTALVYLEACLDWRNTMPKSRRGPPQGKRPRCKNHPGLLNKTVAWVAGTSPQNCLMRTLIGALKQAPGDPLLNVSLAD